MKFTKAQNIVSGTFLLLMILVLFFLLHRYHQDAQDIPLIFFEIYSAPLLMILIFYFNTSSGNQEEMTSIFKVSLMILMFSIWNAFIVIYAADLGINEFETKVIDLKAKTDVLIVGGLTYFFANSEKKNVPAEESAISEMSIFMVSLIC